MSLILKLKHDGGPVTDGLPLLLIQTIAAYISQYLTISHLQKSVLHLILENMSTEKEACR